MNSKKAAKIDGLNLVEIGGRRYEWNEATRSYWSVDGDPRELQATDLADEEATTEAPNLRGEIGKHDWCIGAPCEDGYPVFVDDRQLSYRATPEQAQALAFRIIADLQADGDYRLNDKPQGFLPPKRTPVATLVSSEHGFNDYDVTGLDGVHRIAVGHGIKRGNICNVYCSESCKFGAEWQGSVDKTLTHFAATHKDFQELQSAGRKLTEPKTFDGWVVTPSSSVSAQDILKLGFEVKDHRLYPDDLATITERFGKAGYSVTDVSMPGTTSWKGLPPRCLSIDGPSLDRNVEDSRLMRDEPEDSPLKLPNVGDRVYLEEDVFLDGEETPVPAGWYLLHRVRNVSGKIDSPDALVTLCRENNEPGDYISVLASQIHLAEPLKLPITGKIWHNAESMDEAEQWKVDLLAKGATHVEIKPDAGRSIVSVIITLDRIRANEILGYDVGEEEWLDTEDGETGKPLSDAEYVAKGGGVCPKCGSDQVERDAVDVDGPSASQKVWCLNCDAEWRDVYQLSGYTDFTTTA